MYQELVNTGKMQVFLRSGAHLGSAHPLTQPAARPPSHPPPRPIRSGCLPPSPGLFRGGPPKHRQNTVFLRSGARKLNPTPRANMYLGFGRVVILSLSLSLFFLCKDGFAVRLLRLVPLGGTQAVESSTREQRRPRITRARPQT